MLTLIRRGSIYASSMISGIAPGAVVEGLRCVDLGVWEP